MFQVTENAEQGEFRVHNAECSHVQRDLNRGYDDGGEFDTVESIAYLFFTNQIEEDVDAGEFDTEQEATASYVRELDLMPCAKKIRGGVIR